MREIKVQNSRLFEVQSTEKSIVEPLHYFKFMTIVEPIFAKTEQHLVFVIALSS
jgi:hypothetical protein